MIKTIHNCIPFEENFNSDASQKMYKTNMLRKHKKKSWFRCYCKSIKKILLQNLRKYFIINYKYKLGYRLK